MPQPLSRVAPDAHFEIGNVGTRSLAQRPALAVMAMEAIAAWSHVDSFMLKLYVELAGGEEADAAAVYLAMESSRAKATLVTVLAERKLSPDNLKLLRAIIKVSESAQKDRDKLAHWVWGTSPQLPDALLLADPRTHFSSPERIFVYKQADFEAMRVKFDRIAIWGNKFYFILIGNPANRDGRIYAQLCQEPEIAETLDRQARQG